MRNNTLEEIAREIEKAESVLVYPHVNMDGDAMGSAVALCHGLRDLGKQCYVLIEDSIPRNLTFLDKGYCTENQSCIQMPDISLCLDCGDVGRFLKRKEKFQEGRVSICIDHHRTTKPFCNFNHIDPEAAATGELIYQLLCLLGGPKDRETADALYAAIATDTGNFQYSNTSKKSHQIVAELYDWGLEANQVSQAIYDNVRLPKLLLHSRAMETLELLAGGQGAVAWVNPAMAEEVGAAMDETDGIVEKLRSIEGVEIAAFVKGVSPQQTKVSLRAKSWGDVANIAEKFGGGGHSKAAGCTLKMPLEEGLALIKREVEDALK